MSQKDAEETEGWWWESLGAHAIVHANSAFSRTACCSCHFPYRKYYEKHL